MKGSLQSQPFNTDRWCMPVSSTLLFLFLFVILFYASRFFFVLSTSLFQSTSNWAIYCSSRLKKALCFFGLLTRITSLKRHFCLWLRTAMNRVQRTSLMACLWTLQLNVVCAHTGIHETEHCSHLILMSFIIEDFQVLENNIHGESLLFGELWLSCRCCLLLGVQAGKVLDIVSQSEGDHFASPLEAHGIIFDLLVFTFRKKADRSQTLQSLISCFPIAVDLRRW